MMEKRIFFKQKKKTKNKKKKKKEKNKDLPAILHEHVKKITYQ